MGLLQKEWGKALNLPESTGKSHVKGQKHVENAEPIKSFCKLKAIS